jgi:hypothetical protein
MEGMTRIFRKYRVYSLLQGGGLTLALLGVLYLWLLALVFLVLNLPLLVIGVTALCAFGLRVHRFCRRLLASRRR